MGSMIPIVALLVLVSVSVSTLFLAALWQLEQASRIPAPILQPAITRRHTHLKGSSNAL